MTLLPTLCSTSDVCSFIYFAIPNLIILKPLFHRKKCLNRLASWNFSENSMDGRSVIHMEEATHTAMVVCVDVFQYLHIYMHCILYTNTTYRTLCAALLQRLSPPRSAQQHSTNASLHHHRHSITPLAPLSTFISTYSFIPMPP